MAGVQLDPRASRAVRRPQRRKGACCGHCNRPVDPFGGCRRRACPGYFPTWGRDCAALIRHNIAELGERHDMVTLTAPGSEGLPWDRSRCRHEPWEPCSGRRGCVVQAWALDRFNAGLDERMRKLLRAAKERMRRRGHRPPPMVVTMEPQERGAPHFHVVAATVDRAAFACFYVQVRALAPRYGFGQRVGWDPWRGDDCKGAGGVARYLSKVGAYLAKAGAGDQVAEQLRRMLQRAPKCRVVRCSPALTRRSGVTMRNLRLKRWAWIVTGGEALTCLDAAELHRQHRLGASMGRPIVDAVLPGIQPGPDSCAAGAT